MLQLLLTGLLVSLDGFLSGLSFGIKKIKFSWDKLLIMSLVPFLFSMLIMVFANSMTLVLTETTVNQITFVLFFILFLSSFKEALLNKQKKEPGLIMILNSPDSSDLNHDQIISTSEALLLGCALTLDNSVLSLHYALKGASVVWTPLCFALINLLLVKLGNLILRIPGIRLLQSISSFIPGILFLLLALSRIPGIF